MSVEVQKVEVKADKVMLKLAWRDYGWRIHKRQQITFTKRQFEKALNDAEITIPWKALQR